MKTPTPHATLFQIVTYLDWSKYMVDYLKEMKFPEGMRKQRQNTIEVETESFAFINDQLYKRDKDNQLRTCAKKVEYISILKQAHAGLAKGHFSVKTIAKAILMLGIWWPTLIGDAKEFFKSCDLYRRAKKLIRRDNMPL